MNNDFDAIVLDSQYKMYVFINFFVLDCSERQHYDAILKCSEWQLKAARLPGKSSNMTQQQSSLGSGVKDIGGVLVGAGAAREAAQAAQDPVSASIPINPPLANSQRKNNSLVEKQTSTSLNMSSSEYLFFFQTKVENVLNTISK